MDCIEKKKLIKEIQDSSQVYILYILHVVILMMQKRVRLLIQYLFFVNQINNILLIVFLI